MSYYIDQDGHLAGGGESSPDQDAEDVSDLFVGPRPQSTSSEDSPPPASETPEGRTRRPGARWAHTLEPVKPPLSPKQRCVARALDRDLVDLISETVIILRDEYQVECDEISSSWLAAALLEDWTPAQLARTWMEREYNRG